MQRVRSKEFTDDAYITFRYAQNFVDGHGLVYNIGERVEGYTNFLWTITMILGRLAGFDYVLFSKILGTAFGLATIILLFILVRFIVRDMPPHSHSLLPCIACLLLGTTYSFAYWAVAGLETTAFGFFVLLSIYSYFRRSMILIPALVLATLMRPEGGLVFFFIIIHNIFHYKKLTPYTANIFLLYVLFLLPFIFFRWTYYGALLPNPFYAKVGFSGQQVLHGLEYTWQFIFHYLGAGLFLIPLIVVYRRLPEKIRFIAIFLLAYAIYIIMVGGDVLKVHRFFVPLFPLLFLVIVYSLSITLRKRHLYMLGVVLVLASQLILPRKHVSVFHAAEIGLAAGSACPHPPAELVRAVAAISARRQARRLLRFEVRLVHHVPGFGRIP